MAFADFETAMKTRDVQSSMIENAVNRLRPEPRQAEVFDFSLGNMTCDVLLPGDRVPLRVKMGRDQVPIHKKMDNPDGSAQGDLVRFTGRNGNYYLTEVYGTHTPMASMAYVQSRGMNLITNGLAGTKDNTNFSTMTYVGTDSPAGNGSFEKLPGVANTVISDEMIPVDTNLTYQITHMARQAGASTDDFFYSGLVSYDTDGFSIDPSMCSYWPGTATTLAAPLYPGATTMTLTSSANWNAAGAAYNQRYIIIWDYVDGNGKAWPVNTYSRHTITGNAVAVGGYTSITGNVLTLQAPYAGTTAVAAGTPVSNGWGGGTYKYISASGQKVPSTWNYYSGKIGGVITNGTQSANQFFQGTVAVRFLALFNRIAAGTNDTDSNHRIAAIRLTEVNEENLIDSTTVLTLATNYAAYGGGYGVPIARREGNRVTLSGLVRCNQVTTQANIFTTVPADCRPLANHIFMQGGATAAGDAPIRVTVAINGQVNIQAGITIPVGGYISLSGCVYYVDLP